MSAEKISEKPLLLAEVKEFLEKRKAGKKKFDRAIHERLYDYCKRFVKLPRDKAMLLLQKLLEIKIQVGKRELQIPMEVACDIVNVLPRSREELEPFLAFLEHKQKILLLPKLKEEIASKILGVIREVLCSQ